MPLHGISHAQCARPALARCSGYHMQRSRWCTRLGSTPVRALFGLRSPVRRADGNRPPKAAPQLCRSERVVNRLLRRSSSRHLTDWVYHVAGSPFMLTASCMHAADEIAHRKRPTGDPCDLALMLLAHLRSAGHKRDGCLARARHQPLIGTNLNLARPRGVDEAMRHYVSTPVMHSL